MPDNKARTSAQRLSLIFALFWNLSEKPLKVEVVVDPSKVAAAPVAGAKGAKGAKGAAAAAGAKGKGGRGAAGAASTRGPRRGAAGAKREARPKKTVEDLDAEMEDYNKQASTDAAPGA